MNQASIAIPKSRLEFKLPRLALGMTTRGLLLLIFASYLLAGPVPDQTDIVACVFSYCIIALVVLFASITILNGYTIKKHGIVEIFPPSIDRTNSAGFTSQTKLDFILRVSQIKTLPLFVFTVQPEFEHRGLTLPAHHLVGSMNDSRVIRQEIVFPHRGNWRLSKLKLSFGDQLGLSAIHWEISDSPARKSFAVAPPHTFSNSLPILSSCHRVGDMTVDTRERLGDPFDLKPYHPSDGMKKILWKLFAKRGELIARHPEASMTPEGQVVIFMLANPMEDHVCSACRAYLNALEDLSLSVFFGCEGMKESEIAKSSSAAEEMMVESAWNSAESTSSSIAGELGTLLTSVGNSLDNGRIDRLLIFAAQERLEGENSARLLADLGHQLEQARIQPVFCMIKKNGSSTRKTTAWDGAPQLGPVLKKLPSLVQNWIFYRKPLQDQTVKTAYPHFLNYCLQKNWQVVE